MFCRRSILDELVRKDGYIFDKSFFMYKEDIDICLRVQRLGYRIKYNPDIVVYHCRGWAKERVVVPYWARRMSLVNEWRIAKKNLLPLGQKVIFFFYLIFKSFYVFLYESWKNKVMCYVRLIDGTNK